MLSLIVFIIFLASFITMLVIVIRKVPVLASLTAEQMAKKTSDSREVFFEKIKHYPQPVIKQTLSQAKHIGQAAWKTQARVVTKLVGHKAKKVQDIAVKDIADDDYWDRVKKN